MSSLHMTPSIMRYSRTCDTESMMAPTRDTGENACAHVFGHKQHHPVRIPVTIVWQNYPATERAHGIFQPKQDERLYA